MGRSHEVFVSNVIAPVFKTVALVFLHDKITKIFLFYELDDLPVTVSDVDIQVSAYETTLHPRTLVHY